jgi:hypothetical protein
MNPHDQEKLLREILPPEDIAEFRDFSLECALNGLRRERHRRRIVRLSSTAAVLLCLCVGVLLKTRKPAQIEHASNQRIAQPAPAGLASSHVDLINDDQLLALIASITNRPVALIGKPGDQHLVFLSEPETGSAQHPF